MVKLKFFLFIGIVVVASCISGDILFDEVKEIETTSWNADDEISFSVPVNDTTASYNIYLHVRNNTSYEYSNLWMFIKTTAPGGQSITDTVEFYLADDAGHWLGRGLGSINTMLLPYKANIKFPNRGIYTFDLKQGMRKEELNNILDVGIRIQSIN